MKKQWIRAISLLLCLALVLPMVPARALAAELAKLPEAVRTAEESAPSVDSTRVIETAEEFMAIMDEPDGAYRLGADLNLGTILPPGL